MKTNFFRRLLAGEEATKVVLDAAANGITDFSSDAADLNGNEVVQFSVATIRNVRRYGNEYILLVGMFLEMHRQLTRKEERIFMNVLADLGMSKTQAYRVMAVWRFCGHRLAINPKLTVLFVPEALKLLCEARIPESAREEAFKLAENGKQINIKLAKDICEKHLPSNKIQPVDVVTHKEQSAEPKPSSATDSTTKSMPSAKPSRRSLLSFVGDFAKLVVQAKGKSVDVTTISKPVLANVIRDTEKFLAELRRQHSMMTDTSKLTKVG